MRQFLTNKRVSNLILRYGIVPAGLFCLLAVCFGPLIPRLGFYWDDWPVLLTNSLKGAEGFWKFYSYDRPFSAWTYLVMLPILGTSPLSWQITSLLLRCLTVISMWGAFSGIWPDRWRDIAIAAALFAVYPVFSQQFISVAYSQHWICYWLYFLSLGAMIWSLRRPRYAVPLTLGGILASLVGLFTMEYFAGLELLRPFILWVMLREQPGSIRSRSGSIFRRWLPYLAVFVIFTTWRLFIVDLAKADSNAPSLLFEFSRAPVDTLLRLLQAAAQDQAYLLVTVWADILKPETLQTQDRFILASWGFSLLVAVLAYGAFRRLVLGQEAGAQDASLAREKRWTRQVFALGCAALFLGPLPVWITDRQMIAGTFANRFGLAAMLGASLVVVGAVWWLTPDWGKRVLLISVLVGLSAGVHLRTANDYRWSWVKQSRFYWQLSWRAPSILPHTAIFSDGEIFPYVGLYSTSSAINLLYPPVQLEGYELPYYFYSLGRSFAHDMDEFNRGIPVGVDNFRMYQFNGNTQDGLVIFYEPGINNCLHILTPEDETAPDLPEVTLRALPNANLDRIQDAPASGYPPESIFGDEPEHGWCYLYQKADLARQLGEWDKVVAIGDQAAGAGYTIHNAESNTPFEWLPFIEGYARLGRWEEATQITRDAVARDSRIAPRMCRLWSMLQAEGYPQAGRVMSELNCAP